MAHKDYIEHSYGGFDAQYKLIIDAVQANTGGSAPVWNHIPAEARAGLEAGYADYHPRHLAAESPSRSKIDVEERGETRRRVEPVLRNFCQRFFYAAPEIVTNAQLESMNLRPRDRTRTVRGKPQWRVGIEIEPSKTRTHTLRWHVEENESRAIPEGCNGWVLVYRVLEPGDPVPGDPEDLGHSQLVTRNPFVVEHKPGDEGKRVAYCGAFQSTGRGLKGDWGEIVVGVLP
ncbi:MAG: hypothetical protein LBG84_10025 [Treponema sp.]|jgi:hypothetical protein|nr:hypothetical protein [Treponema sp.]